MIFFASFLRGTPPRLLVATFALCLLPALGGAAEMDDATFANYLVERSPWQGEFEYTYGRYHDTGKLSLAFTSLNGTLQSTLAGGRGVGTVSRLKIEGGTGKVSFESTTGNFYRLQLQDNGNLEGTADVRTGGESKIILRPTSKQ